MNFTISYLAADRLGGLENLKPSIISPMKDLASTIAEMQKNIDRNVLDKIDDMLLEQKLLVKTENGNLPAKQLDGFLKALYAPQKCVQARLSGQEGCSDTYFILFDGAWLKLEAVRGQFTVTGPFSENAVDVYLRAGTEIALKEENVRFLAERRKPDNIHSEVILADEKGYQFFGSIINPGENKRTTYMHPFVKTEENRAWIADMIAGRRDFVLPEGEKSAQPTKRSYKKALKGFLIALAVNACVAIILAVLRTVL